MSPAIYSIAGTASRHGPRLTDSLGYRKKFAVVVPSTNTSVQPELDAMRPAGVTNHISRIVIRDRPVNSSEDSVEVLKSIAATQQEAIDAAMSLHPDHMVLGISAESFWDGLEASHRLEKEIASHTGLKVSMGSTATVKALNLLKAKRIAGVSPFWPVGDEKLRSYFSEAGFEVKRVKGLKGRSPVLIAHISETDIRQAMKEVDGDDVDAIICMGTNMACARLAGEAEAWLGKPVIAVNTAIYWHALRTAGIQDKVGGFGSLLQAH